MFDGSCFVKFISPQQQKLYNTGMHWTRAFGICVSASSLGSASRLTKFKGRAIKSRLWYLQGKLGKPEGFDTGAKQYYFTASFGTLLADPCVTGKAIVL